MKLIDHPHMRHAPWSHRFFVVSVLLKGLDGLFEILGGLAALFVSHVVVMRIVELLVHQELVEDPHDVIANYVVHAAATFVGGTQLFVALYLLVHGVVKVWLVESLLRERAWAYPVALVVFGLFTVYQIYAYTMQPGVALAFLTALDLVVIVLTYHEYRTMRWLRPGAGR